MSEVKNAVEWQNKAHEADTTVRDQVHQIQILQDELHQSRTLVQHKSEEQLELQRQLGILQANAEKEGIIGSKVNDLTAQVQQLQSSLSEKDAAVAESKKDLAATQEELRTEVRRLQDKEEQFQNERQSHARAIESSTRERNEAVLHAVAQEIERAREEHRLKEIQLQEDMGRERAQLEQELAKSRQAVEAANRVDIGEDIRQIRGELATANVSITGLKAALEESEHKREVLLARLEQWSHDRDEIGQMQQMLQRLAKEQPNAVQMGRGLRELLEMQKNISGTIEKHQAHLANAEAVVAAKQAQQNDSTAKPFETKSNPTSGTNNGADYLDVEAQILKRKVVLKSPAGEDDRASPVSVEQERSTRRQSVPPRGIMKLLIPSTSGQLEATGSGAEIDSQMPREPQPPPKRKIAKRGLNTTRSLYNRPVSGSVPGTSREQEDAKQVGSSSGHKSDATGERVTPNETLDPPGFLQDPEEPPMKRQRASEANQQLGQMSYTAPSTKSVRSMTGYFPAQKPEDGETTEAPKTVSSRGGPIKRRQSGLVGGSRSNNQSSFASSQTLSAASDEQD